ncbi:helix-turn-helix domain-containing protein [Paraburkholderia sp. JHI2823]|uniref:helix-turn-helix domain-containing protein n=1 Tax=Paraburkholderia sp. JHI2823 TaxID=3112960 RepID=UPI00316E7C7D
MRQIKEVLHLHANGQSHREIASALRLSRATVWEYLDRARRGSDNHIVGPTPLW